MLKKLVLFVVFLGLAGVVHARQGSGNATLTAGERNQTFVTVYNEDAVDHAAGSILVYKDGSYDGVSVSSTTTANNPLVAGVVPVGYTLPASGWGFVQISGYHSAIKIGVANSAGDLLGTSTTADKAGVYSVVGTTTTTGTAAKSTDLTASFGVAAVALEATTSSTTVKGFIKLQ
jgi:hypothetical protein